MTHRNLHSEPQLAHQHAVQQDGDAELNSAWILFFKEVLRLQELVKMRRAAQGQDAVDKPAVESPAGCKVPSGRRRVLP